MMLRLAHRYAELERTVGAAATRVAGVGGAGYAGCHGMGNLGDDAMWAVAGRLLGAGTHTFHPAKLERRLGQLGLSGRRWSRRVWLGGGTLVNERFLPPLQLAVERGVPVATFGSGVGGSGLEHNGFELSGWAELLTAADGVGVRGPRSAAALRAIGVDQAEVVGDPALCLAGARPAAAGDRPRFAWNVAGSATGDQTLANAEADRAQAVAAGLIAAGWELVPVAMAPGDVPLLAERLRALEVSSAVHQPKDFAAFAALVGPCTATVAVRLHASVLSTALGVPSVVVAYADKCLDFLESVGLQRFVCSQDAETSAAMAASWRDEGADLREQVWSAARESGAVFEAYVRRVMVS